MSSNVNSQIIQQKKIARGLKGFILALVALIGILKISVGAIVNVPVALLFGDMFVAIFGLIILLSFYLMLFPFPKKKRRTALVFFSIFSLIIIASTFYAGIRQNFTLDSATFNNNLADMMTKGRETFSFSPPKDAYWYGYGGLVGDGLLLLLSPLHIGLIITILVFFALVFLVFIFWPLIRALIKHIRASIIENKKRRAVLEAAGELGVEEEKEEPVQVKVEEAIEEPVVYTSSLLHPVTPTAKAPSEAAPLNASPYVKEYKAHTTDSFEKITMPINDEDFGLPSLDNDEELQSVTQTPVLEQLSRVDTEDYEVLQKAVETSGTIEPVFVAPEEEVSEELEEVSEESVETDNYVPAFLKEDPLATLSEESEDETLDEERSEIEAPISEEPVAKETPKEEPKPERIKRKYVRYQLPDINLLSDPLPNDKEKENEDVALDFSERINTFFRDFNIDASVASWTIGSTFTRYEISLGPTETINSIKNLMNDISLRLNGASIRFEPIIPGKALSGIEVANKHRVFVNFKESMQRISAERVKKYYVPMGKDVAGNIIISPFSEFPHLLVAGATGSGKSVFIHTVLTSLIMFHSPVDLKLLLIDPKRVELAQYHSIPHLLTPIVKDASEAKVALDRLIDEMERRYKLFETTGVSKFSDYNEVIEEIGGEKIPLIIAIVDEFADLFESEKEISTSVLRLVQKSRAAGIHLLIATQRPSVQVITGNIKANIPSRVAFMTASTVDSITILGQGGSELLLGHGDMLVDSITVGRGLVRVQAPFIPVKEVLRITNYLRNNYEPDFHEDFLDLKEKVAVFGNGPAADDELYPSVVAFVETLETISISRLQQQFGLGWPRARGLYDLLLQNGIIEAPDEANSAKGATVLINRK